MLLGNLRPIRGRTRVSEVNVGTKELKSTETFIVKRKTKVQEVLLVLGELTSTVVSSTTTHLQLLFCDHVSGHPTNAIMRRVTNESD